MTAPCEPIKTATTQLLEPVYISATDVAQLVGVDPATIYRWASTYLDMPTLRIGGVVRFHRQRILSWLERHEQSARAQRRTQRGGSASNLP